MRPYKVDHKSNILVNSLKDYFISVLRPYKVTQTSLKSPSQKDNNQNTPVGRVVPIFHHASKSPLSSPSKVSLKEIKNICIAILE